VINGAAVSGTGSGAIKPIFRCCTMDSANIPVSVILNCGLDGDMVFNAIGTYIFEGCYSAIAGTATPSVDVGVALGNTSVNFRHYSGGIEFKNLGQVGTDNVSVEGDGQVVLNANCVGGTIAIRGHMDLTDNSATTTVSDDSRFTRSETAVGVRQEMDSNSTQLAAIVEGTVQKNAAFSNFEFLMVLTSDHATPATGLTVTGQRSIDGGAFASVSGAIAEVSNGIYQFDALAADTNGDLITWRFSSATADDVFVTFKTTS
jgi:hypothetical protein